MNAPATYAQWTELLAALKARTNDEDVLDAMKRGTIVWQSGVAERFTASLAGALNARMNAAADRFSAEISRAAGHETALAQAIIALRKEMAFLHEAVSLPAIPEQERASFCALVREQANKMQSSLENSAKTDRSGKLSSVIRNNRVNSF